MKLKKGFIILIVLFVFNFNGIASTTLTKMLSSSNAMIEKVSIHEALKWFNNKSALFIDVDEPYEFNEATIIGALNIPRGILEFKITRHVHRKTRRIVIFSKNGKRGILSTYNLQGLGYTKVYNLKGGLMKWKRAKFPITSLKKTKKINKKEYTRKYHKKVID